MTGMLEKGTSAQPSEPVVRQFQTLVQRTEDQRPALSVHDSVRMAPSAQGAKPIPRREERPAAATIPDPAPLQAEPERIPVQPEMPEPVRQEAPEAPVQTAMEMPPMPTPAVPEPQQIREPERPEEKPYRIIGEEI